LSNALTGPLGICGPVPKVMPCVLGVPWGDPAMSMPPANIWESPPTPPAAVPPAFMLGPDCACCCCSMLSAPPKPELPPKEFDPPLKLPSPKELALSTLPGWNGL